MRGGISALMGRAGGAAVIVVDDGSTKGTQEAVSGHPNAVLVERGAGWASSPPAWRESGG